MLKDFINIINLNRVSSILFCLIPFALLTGPFLPDLLLSIICLFFLIAIISENLDRYYNNNYFKIFLSFFIFLLFVSFISNNITFSLKSSLFYFRFFIFGFAIWYLIDNQRDLIKYFFYSLLFAYLFAIMDGYYQYFFDSTIIGIQIDSVRLSLPFNDKLILGGYLARLFPLLVGLFIFCIKKNIRNYLLLGLLFILTDFLVFITGERTALGLIAISTIAIIVLVPDYRIIRIITFFISLALIFLISFTSSPIKERNVDFTIEQLGINSENSQINLFSPIHDSHIRSAIKMFLDNPLHGQGPNMFRKLCNDVNFNYNIHSCSTHPHHNYVQLLAETGIIGFIYMISFFLLLCGALVKFLFYFYFRREKILLNIQICIYISMICTLWPLLPTMNFFNNWINIIYYLPLGFFLYFHYSNKAKNEI